MKKRTAAILFMFGLVLSAQSQALPPSVKIDMLKTQMIEQLKTQQYADAVQTMQDLKATGIELPASFEYFEGKALFESGRQAASYDKFAHYIETQGKEGRYYKETIAYLIKAEKPTVKASLWKHVFGGSKDDKAGSLVQTADGGFVLAGYTRSKGKGKGDGWLIRLNAEGQLLWERDFGGSQYDGLRHIIQTTDGGFAAIGNTKSKGVGEQDVWFIRLDAEGQLLWERSFGGSAVDEGNTLVQTADGGFALVGLTRSKGKGEADAWLIYLDAEGQLLWERSFGGVKADKGYSLIQTADGGFALVGLTWSKGKGKADAWLIRVDAEGQLLWERSFGGGESDVLKEIIQTNDGGFAVVGNTKSKGVGEQDVWFIRLDAKGQPIWERSFGGAKVDRGYSLIQTADGGFAVVGDTNSKSAGRLDAWLILLNRLGEPE